MESAAIDLFFNAGDQGPVLSAYQTEFLRFVEQHPECLEARTFECLPIPKEPGSRLVLMLNHDIPIQPWPLFLDATTFTRLGDIALRSFELVRSLPERLFDNDARRLCEFYELDPAITGNLARVLALPWRRGSDLMRGDYLLSSGRLKCIEINAVARTGGLFGFQAAEALLQEPILQRFFEQQQVTVRYRDPWRNLLLTLIEQAMARGLHRDGKLNVAFLVHQPTDDYLPAVPIIEPAFKALLARCAPGLEGRVLFCADEDLERVPGALKARGEPVQGVIQIRGGTLTDPPAPEVEAWLDGVIELYPGPLTWIYSDKRNLALLSAHAETPGLFSREEAAWIDEHLPWSRIVQPGPTLWRGRQKTLETLLLTAQAELVLKPSQSLGGAGVRVGCKTSVADWQSTVESAMKYPGTYMVQEHLRDDLQFQQQGEKGYARCSINWGLFVAGDRFGGVYLRSCPPPEDGIVNVANGAADGCVFELRPAGEADEESEIDVVRTFQPPA